MKTEARRKLPRFPALEKMREQAGDMLRLLQDACDDYPSDGILADPKDIKGASREIKKSLGKAQTLANRIAYRLETTLAQS
jgi:hypothetical protein